MTGQVVPEGLAAMDKGCLGDTEEKIFILDLHQGMLPANHLQNSRVHIWRGHKDGTGHDKGYLGSHIVLNCDREAPVSLSIRLSRNAVGHLPLHHDHKLAKRDLALNQVHEDGGGDIVGQVSHDLDGQIRILEILNLRLQIGLQDVLIDHGHIVKATQGIRQNRNQAVVNLKGHDLGSIFRQKLGQGPDSRANFDDIDILVNLRRVHNLLQNIGISQKVLTEGFFKGKPVAFKNSAGNVFVCDSHVCSLFSMFGHKSMQYTYIVFKISTNKYNICEIK